MVQHGDGEKLLDSYPIVSAAIMVKDTHSEIKKAGIENCVTERIVHSVVPAIEAVTLKAINNAPQFNVTTSKIINAQKVLSKYPDIVKLMTDEAIRDYIAKTAKPYKKPSLVMLFVLLGLLAVLLILWLVFFK